MSSLVDFTRRSFLLAAGAAPLLRGQSLLRRLWTARWIAVPNAPRTEYGVYHFRKSFDLAARPERFLVHASGDNRYQLFVNGERAAGGPGRPLRVPSSALPRASFARVFSKPAWARGGCRPPLAVDEQ